MRTQTSRRGGFTLVEIMIVVAIIGLLAAIAIPNFVKARTYSQKNACIKNIQQIHWAKHNWALDNNKAASVTPNDADIYGSAAYIRVKPKCPTDNSDYTLNNVETPPDCANAASGHAL